MTRSTSTLMGLRIGITSWSPTLSAWRINLPGHWRSYVESKPGHGPLSIENFSLYACKFWPNNSPFYQGSVYWPAQLFWASSAAARGISLAAQSLFLAHCKLE
jgi:hypothetical protein